MKDPNRRRHPVADRLVEVIDDRQTGETILDEALKMMKAQESDKMGINSWIDLLSGEFALSICGFALFSLCNSASVPWLRHLHGIADTPNSLRSELSTTPFNR